MTCILGLVTEFSASPLVRWDGFHLVVGLEQAEAVLREKIATIEQVADIRLGGAGDSIDIAVTLAWKGVRAKVAVRLGEIRLRRRFFGCRLRRIHVLGGVRIPRAIVESLLASFGQGLITVMRRPGIVIADLSRWIPPEVEVSIVTVQATRRNLHVWFGPGGMTRVPVRADSLPDGMTGALLRQGQRVG